MVRTFHLNFYVLLVHHQFYGISGDHCSRTIAMPYNLIILLTGAILLNCLSTEIQKILNFYLSARCYRVHKSPTRAKERVQAGQI